MGFGVTIFFYLLIGASIGATLWINSCLAKRVRLFVTLSAPLFWPLYVPFLFESGNNGDVASVAIAAARNQIPTDDMANLIVKVESELEQALQSLDGWEEKTLADEQARITELRKAWRRQADSIRELDRLVENSDESNADLVSGNASVTEASMTSNQSMSSVRELGRRENIEKLKRVRQQLFDDLTATLAWVRELVTMIHLARYSGAPASRAVELVQQIAAAVEGLSKTHQAAI